MTIIDLILKIVVCMFFGMFAVFMCTFTFVMVVEAVREYKEERKNKDAK